MISACNKKGIAGLDSFEREIARRVAIGDTRSVLYIVPTGAQARDLINRVTALANDQAVTVPYILSLSELISKLRFVVSPELELLSASESAALIEVSIRELFTHHKLEYFEQRGSGASLPVFQGTFDEIVSTINNIKERGVSIEELRLLLDLSDFETPTSEQRKLRDIIEIFRQYDELLGETSIDQYGQYSVLVAKLGLPLVKSSRQGVDELENIFRRVFPEVQDVFIAPFVRFTEPALQLLLAMGYLESLRVTFELDYAPTNFQLFRYQQELAQLLQAEEYTIAQKDRSDIPKEIVKFRSILRDYLFVRKNRTKNDKPSFDAENVVSSFNAPTIEEEVRHTARSLKQLIREHPDLDYSTLCVASVDQDKYAPIILSIFREYGIPFQLTHRTALDNSPLFYTLNNLLEVGLFKLSRSRVRGLLESPYLKLSRINGVPIDKQPLLRVLNRYHFPQGSKEWHHLMKEIAFDLETQLRENFEDESERRKAESDLTDIAIAIDDMVVIETIVKEFSISRTPNEFVKFIREQVSKLSIVSLILSGSDAMLAIDELEIETRSYRAFFELTDELLTVCATLGYSDTELPLSFYLERIKTAASRMRYTVRPEPGSAITVTSFDQTIGSEFKHLFLLGLRDGLFPSGYKPSLFTPKEYSLTHDSHLLEARFLFYQTLCTFTGSLHLSLHSGVEDATRGYHQSVFLDALREVIAIRIEDDNDHCIFSQSELHQTIAPTIDWASNEAVAEISNTAEQSGLASKAIERLHWIEPQLILMERERRTILYSRYAGMLSSGELSPEQELELESYRDNVFSVSQLETYASCGFKYFCRYVLGISQTDGEPEEGLEQGEQGTILHNSLHHILERFRDSGQNIRTMGSEANVLAHSIIAELYPESQVAKMHPFARLDRERLLNDRGDGKSIIDRFIDTEQSDAVREITSAPAYFELVFGTPNADHRSDYPDPKLPVEIDGIKLRGKIDRIDMDDDGHIVVVDYKKSTGAEKKDIENGYSLQLPLYLRIAEDMLRAHLGNDTVKGVAALYHSLKYGSDKRDFRLALSEAIENNIIERPTARYKAQSLYELAEFIEKVISFAKGYVDGIAQGKFPLVNASRRSTSCAFCECKPVCRVEQAEADGMLPIAR